MVTIVAKQGQTRQGWVCKAKGSLLDEGERERRKEYICVR